jgi:hypothetical protein
MVDCSARRRAGQPIQEQGCGTGDLFGSSPTFDSVIIIENGSLTIANGSSISTARTAIVMTGDNSSPANINFPTGNG